MPHPPTFRNTLRAALLLAAAGLSVAPAAAQLRPDPLRFVTWPVEDAVGLVADVDATDALYVAGFGAALFALSRLDEPLTDRAVGITEGRHVRIVEEFGNAKVVRPMGIVLFTGALLSGDHRFQDAAFTSLEAVLVANLVTNSLKSIMGRSRPYQDRGAGVFDPFSGDRSFPSGHATTAFAFLTPWALYYPGPASAGLLVLATATSFSRIATNQHWFTDVLGGSAVGFMTAYALTRRHLRIGSTRIRPTLGPGAVTLEMRF